MDKNSKPSNSDILSLLQDMLSKENAPNEKELIYMMQSIMGNHKTNVSNELRRRVNNDEISELIAVAKSEIRESDFDDEFEYLNEVILYVIEELSLKYGDEDNFWYDNENEIIDYIKFNFGEELFG
jgi:hypothetical protein